jgi:hypothetical protein
MRTSVLAAAVLAIPLAGCASSGEERAAAVRAGGDWTRFGYDAARHNAGPKRTGINANNVGRLRRQQVSLDGTVDSSPIYLRDVPVKGTRQDVFIVTTSYGKTIAVSAVSGAVLWRYIPSRYRSWAGGEWITQASPVASRNRRFVYAASPNGRIHKIRVANGREVRSGRWPTLISRRPATEKIGTALNLSRGLVLATVGGHLGDAPPYQGHVVAINAKNGRIVRVWNALCSDRHRLLAPSRCPESGSAIWARSGAVVIPGSRRLLVATGNGKWNGRIHWGDSVLMLSRNAGTLRQNWTPRDQSDLEASDVDLGSTAPAVLNAHYAVQGGKDGKLRLLDLRRMNGRRSAGPRTGGELQTVPAPGRDGVFSAPAVWRSGKRRLLFVSTDSGTAAWTLRNGRLRRQWRRGGAGTSPIVAGGLLYVYDPRGGGLRVYRPRSGRLVTTLPAGSGHWNSPIVTDGRIALGEGDANEGQTSGVLDIYRRP